MWLASRVQTWKPTGLIVQPETILRWHRDLFQWLWRRKSKPKAHRQPLSAALVALIKRLVRENRLWGAERIRGELLKLGIRISKRTLQKYARQVAPPRRGKQTWTTFIHNHAAAVWSGDLLQVMDVFFRDVFLFFIMEVGSRKIVHVAVARHPTDACVLQSVPASSRHWSMYSRIALTSHNILPTQPGPPLLTGVGWTSSSPSLGRMNSHFTGKSERMCIVAKTDQ